MKKKKETRIRVPVKIRKKKRRKKKKKILIPRIVRFTRTQVSKMYGLKCKIKRSKGYKDEAKAHTITIYSPTELLLGELGLHKTNFAQKKMWLLFGSKGGLFCSGSQVEKVLKSIKDIVVKEFKGKVL
jgi:hypothetical protein